MELSLKISCSDKVDSSVLSALRDSKYHYAKLSTTKVQIVPDRRDQRLIDSLKNIKIVLKKQDEGILILLGNLQCDHRPPYGGAFYITRVVNEVTEYASVRGVSTRVRFATMDEPITDNRELEPFMQELIKDKDFQFNIGQFDEFMEIFEFYKKLSDELNNNISYEVESQSKPYYFIPFDVKDFDSEFKVEVKDQNGVLKGYRFDATTFVYLKNEIKEHVRELIDIHIKGGMEQLSRIRRVGEDNIYLSNTFNVSEKDVKNLKQFVVVNITIQKDEVVLSGELKNEVDYEDEYSCLNLYDMGQKIKVESIDNSLRLINQGATGAAAELLEYLIGDKKMPNNGTLEAKLTNMLLDKDKYTYGLNDSQKKAFLMAIDGSPVSLIKGPPGTGKTHVINAIVQYITKELGEKVIISSQTHIAIDNVLDKLVENYDIVIPNRITNRRNKYSGNEIDYTLYRTWGRKFSEHNKRATNKKLAAAMEEAMSHFGGEQRFKYAEMSSSEDFSVIGATTTTSAIAGKKGLEVLKGYDWLIIDEVSKCPITEVLRYLPYVSRIIMVGDDFQLAPLLEFSKDDVKELPSYDEEMFQKLQSIYEQSVFAKTMDKAAAANRLVLLNENYRSVKDVLSAYNVFYDGQLIDRREEIRPDKVRFNVRENDIDYDGSDVFFVEVENGQEAREGTSRFNLEEIAATEYILRDLMKTVKNPENVSVSAIFPYAAQINKFQKNNLKLINEANKLFKSFEIDTVDAFQGKETDIVLVNTVVTDSTQGNFLNDFRRINVSMSRARDKLIVFGNHRVLRRIKMKIAGGQERNYFGEIIDFITAKGQFIKYNGGKVEHGNKSKSSIKLA
jgi:superfamily I DNA and/or RNA helicase